MRASELTNTPRSVSGSLTRTVLVMVNLGQGLEGESSGWCRWCLDEEEYVMVMVRDGQGGVGVVSR